METNAKIIKLKSVELQELIKASLKNDRAAQKELYEKYAPLFLSICDRYMEDRSMAEDAMIEAFFTIFDRMRSYKGQGSFEGWMKRIVVTTCLMKLRKQKKSIINIEEVSKLNSDSADPEEKMFEKDILGLLATLPLGYRTIFNLYAVEGYKHREIAEMLGISINTSKSQLIQARRKLSELINQQEQRTKYGSNR